MPLGLPLGPSRPASSNSSGAQPYTGPARACIHALKYGGEMRLVDPLADLLAARWQRAGVGGDVLVPVPVHPARRRERGFDQAEVLARAVGRRLKLPVAYALRRASRTTAQHALGRRARSPNVGRAFALADDHAQAIAGRWVVLVDDIVTTGATLAAARSSVARRRHAVVGLGPGARTLSLSSPSLSRLATRAATQPVDALTCAP